MEGLKPQSAITFRRKEGFWIKLILTETLEDTKSVCKKLVFSKEKGPSKRSGSANRYLSKPSTIHMQFTQSEIEPCPEQSQTQNAKAED